MKPWVDGPPVSGTLFNHIVTQRQLRGLEKFLAPKWPDDLHDPFLLPDMEKAVERIWAAIEKNEGIGIVGDYDMDGTPAAALLWQFFRLCDITPRVILPTRAEGYGFAPAFVGRLASQGITLILTVDCGIRDTIAVSLAQTKNIDVILTDHHECPDVLPEAFAVINPKRDDSSYPFRELCGTGVAYKLVEAAIRRAPQRYQPRVPQSWLAWSLDLVALATIGDMVPLVDENRVLVYYGLQVLKRQSRPGLRRFMHALGLDANTMTYQDIAYKLLPKCNASGRMEDMEDVFTLLTSTKSEELEEAVGRILIRATQSQLLTTKIMEEAQARIEEVGIKPIILLADESWHPGVTGIVAARLVEKYQRPVGVFAGSGDQLFRGSMRSIQGVNLPDLLAEGTEYIERFGGHEQAAGLSIKRDQFAHFENFFSQRGTLPDSKPSFTTDGTITAQHAELDKVVELGQLAPWGMAHPEPLWSLTGVSLQDIAWLSDGQHCRAVVKEGISTLPVIFFGAQQHKTVLDDFV